MAFLVVLVYVSAMCIKPGRMIRLQERDVDTFNLVPWLLHYEKKANVATARCVFCYPLRRYTWVFVVVPIIKRVGCTENATIPLLVLKNPPFVSTFFFNYTRFFLRSWIGIVKTRKGDSASSGGDINKSRLICHPHRGGMQDRRSVSPSDPATRKGSQSSGDGKT